MTALEGVLVRFLTDPGFLDAYKQGKVDLQAEFGLAKSEKAMLDATMSVGDGTALDSIVNAFEHARAQLMTSGGGGKVSWAARQLERVAPKLERVAPKLERVAPKLERVAPKLERVAPKLERVEPKLERVAPKLERVEPKLERVAPKLERVEPKLERVASKLERLESKVDRADV